MRAKKDNKVYRIDPDSKKRYMDEGYDIYDDNGNLIQHSPLKKSHYPNTSVLWLRLRLHMTLYLQK